MARLSFSVPSPLSLGFTVIHRTFLDKTSRNFGWFNTSMTGLKLVAIFAPKHESWETIGVTCKKARH